MLQKHRSTLGLKTSLRTQLTSFARDIYRILTYDKYSLIILSPCEITASSIRWENRPFSGKYAGMTEKCFKKKTLTEKLMIGYL